MGAEVGAAVGGGVGVGVLVGSGVGVHLYVGVGCWADGAAAMPVGAISTAINRVVIAMKVKEKLVEKPGFSVSEATKTWFLLVEKG